MGALSFVESIAADPVVLIDLDDAPLRLESWQAPPPRVRRSVASSNMVDGGVDTAVSFELRELTATLTVDAADEDEAAAVLSAIGRALSAPRWLRYQAGTSEAVFFRTRVCAPDEIDEFGLTNPGIKRITLVIPADPFAYGLPESGTATIVNDPTQPNGMRFTIPSVKGDAPSPLRLELTPESGVDFARFCAGVTTDVTGIRSATVSVDVASPPFPVDQWEVVEQSRSGTVTGTFLRLAATNLGASLGLSASFPAIRPGDYRVFIRALTDQTGAADLRVTGDSRSPEWPQEHAFTASAPIKGKASVIGSEQFYAWEWVDCGVVRLPGGSQFAVNEGSSEAVGDGTVRVLIRQTGGLWVGVDHMLVVPTPGADGASGTFGRYRATYTWHPVLAHVLASEQDAYAQVTDGGEYVGQADGGFPRVTPGVPNLVSVLANSNELSAACTATYSYAPRYLYLRGD